MATATKTEAKKKAETFRDSLRRIGACEDARKWVGDRSAKQVWADCERPEWMLWLLGKVDGTDAGSPSRRKYVAIACECARLTLDNFEKHFPKDDRPRKAIELCERYAAGEDVSFEELRRAAESAGRAAASAWRAADSAGRAADSAGRAADSEWRGIKIEACGIIRKHFPKCPKI